MRVLIAAFIVLFWSLPVFAAGEKHIYFLDGARIEREVAARKGVIEVPLPAAMLSGTFRVKPLGSAAVRWVEIGPASTNDKKTEQLTALKERRAVLLDRIKNLDDQEGIFKAAAKSQSGRALRKTRNNPDPLGALRSGTRFALAQLEEVSTSRRQARKVLADVEARIAVLKEQSTPPGVARIWLSPSDGKVRVVYLVSNLKWTPWYDFRLSGNRYAEVALCAKMPPEVQSISRSVVPQSVVDSFGTVIEPFPVSAGVTSIANFRFPLEKEDLTTGAVPYLSLVFSNSSVQNLPSGEANGYWKGEYFGTSTFGGCPAGKSLPLVFGKQ